MAEWVNWTRAPQVEENKRDFSRKLFDYSECNYACVLDYAAQDFPDEDIKVLVACREERAGVRQTDGKVSESFEDRGRVEESITNQNA